MDAVSTRLSAELDELDALSRRRPLSDGESRHLELLIRLVSPRAYTRAALGSRREAARLGLRRTKPGTGVSRPRARNSAPGPDPAPSPPPRGTVTTGTGDLDHD